VELALEQHLLLMLELTSDILASPSHNLDPKQLVEHPVVTLQLDLPLPEEQEHLQASVRLLGNNLHF
jgi:hypothetical protein